VKHRETEDARGFRANCVACVSKVSGYQVRVPLAHMTELEQGFMGAVHVLHRAAEAFDSHTCFPVDLGDLAGRTG
jgi:hypothetical protein